MIITNEYGTVDFLGAYPDFYKHKRIAINLSGGTDSALLLWILCNVIRDDQTIIPLTLVDIDRPTNIWNAHEVLDFMKEKFPNVKFDEQIVGEFQKTKEHPDKRYHHVKFVESVKKQDLFDVVVHGTTRNPSDEEMKQGGFYDSREKDRDNTKEPIVRRDFYATFKGVTKKWIAQVYRDNDLMELFDMTASCIGKAHKTAHFSKACKQCWWCKEKFWAFGCYDYGEI